PPYSPDLNPIEKCWANLKKKIKNEIANFDSLVQAIDHAFQGIV
ncbi:transposase, partial [Legionella yabuuchiae]